VFAATPYLHFDRGALGPTPLQDQQIGGLVAEAVIRAGLIVATVLLAASESRRRRRCRWPPASTRSAAPPHWIRDPKSVNPNTAMPVLGL